MKNFTKKYKQWKVTCFRLKENFKFINGFKLNLLSTFLLCIGLLLSSFESKAHTVTYTYSGCWSSSTATGYSIDFTVAYAQSNSNYRWQYYENG